MAQVRAADSAAVVPYIGAARVLAWLGVGVAHQPLETPGRVLVVRVAEDIFDRIRRREEVIGT